MRQFVFSPTQVNVPRMSTALAPAPAIYSVAPAAPSITATPLSAAPAIGSVAPVGSTTTSVISNGTLAGPSAAPPIGSVTPAPSQVLALCDDPVAPSRTPYAPPTDAIPAPPEVPGKWQPAYTRDKKSYVVPGLDGIRQTDTLTRATSHAKVLDDTGNLTDWQLRSTVLGLARNPELLDGLALDGAEHISELDWSSKRALSSVAWQAARRSGAHDGSEFGTMVHGYLQAVLEGVLTLDEVPSMIRPYLVVLFAAMRRHNLNFVASMVERTVFIPATGMVGTFDFLVIDAEGTLMIGDLKTSSSIDLSWLAIAVQLAQYATASLMLTWNGSGWEPMPPVSQVIAKVAAVPKDAAVPSCRIYSVDLRLGKRLMDTATWVRHVHEAAARSASNPQLQRAGDDLVAWADDEALLLNAVPALA